jgi:hypothetical protein
MGRLAFNEVDPRTIARAQIRHSILDFFWVTSHSGALVQRASYDVQLHIGESRDSGLVAARRPGMTAISAYVASGVGMVRNDRVTCQNNSRLVASVSEWAVPGRMTS